MSLPCQTEGPVRGARWLAGVLMEAILSSPGRASRKGLDQRFAHVDRRQILEAGMRLARGFPVAERLEQALIVGEDDPDTQTDTGQTTSPGNGFHGLDQSPARPVPRAAGSTASRPK